MADEIKLKIGGDTSGLEKAVEKAFAKMKSSAATFKMPFVTPGAADAIRSATVTRTQTDQKIREEKAGLEIINRTMKERKALVDGLIQQQSQQIKGSKEELEILNKRIRAEERLQQAQKVAQIQQANVNRAQANQNRLYGGGGGGGSEISPGPKPGFGGFSVPGSIGAIAGAVVMSINQIAGSASRGIVAGGSAVSSTAGREYSSIYNGSLPTEMAFSKERAQAKEMADKQEAANRSMDTAKAAAGIALGMAAPAMALSGVGIPAAGASALGSMGMLLSSQRMRAQTFGSIAGSLGFSGIAKTQHQEYENLLAQQNSQDFMGNYEAKKQLNPTKVLGVNDYNQNSQRDLDFQRQMGLNMGSFRGTFKNSIFNAGFDDTQGMGMASGIMGAGGSTRASTGLAGFGLQAQRSLDMTNAGGVIGTLSKSLGGADTTKEAFIKILAEGTRVGLDGSEFREENRKFVEAAAQVVSQSGVTSGAGVDQIMSQFGKFFGDKTGAGLAAGQGAYDLYRQTSMATSGPRGTMRAAGMLSDPTISKLDRDSREALFNMPIDQLTPDNPAIIAMAKQANISPQQLIDAQNKITSKSANQFARSDRARDSLSAVKKKYGASSAIGFQGPLSAGAYDEMTNALGESNIAQIKEHPELGQNQRLTSAYSDALSSGDTQKQGKILEEAKKAQIESNASVRPEDETNKVRAEMSREINRVFMDMKDAIVPAAGAAANFVEQIKKLNAAMMALPEGDRAAYANKNILSIFGATPTNAPSAGSPSSGGGSGH